MCMIRHVPRKKTPRPLATKIAILLSLDMSTGYNHGQEEIITTQESGGCLFVMNTHIPLTCCLHPRHWCAWSVTYPKEKILPLAWKIAKCHVHDICAGHILVPEDIITTQESGCCFFVMYTHIPLTCCLLPRYWCAWSITFPKEKILPLAKKIAIHLSIDKTSLSWQMCAMYSWSGGNHHNTSKWLNFFETHTHIPITCCLHSRHWCACSVTFT